MTLFRGNSPINSPRNEGNFENCPRARSARGQFSKFPEIPREEFIKANSRLSGSFLINYIFFVMQLNLKAAIEVNMIIWNVP